jgi:hypothetical protein
MKNFLKFCFSVLVVAVLLYGIGHVPGTYYDGSVKDALSKLSNLQLSSMLPKTGMTCDNDDIVAEVLKLGTKKNNGIFLESRALAAGVKSETPEYSLAKQKNENEIKALGSQINALYSVCAKRIPVHLQKMIQHMQSMPNVQQPQSSDIRGIWTAYCDGLNNAETFGQLGKLGGIYDSPEDYVFWRENYEPIRNKIAALKQKNKELDFDNQGRIQRETAAFKYKLNYRLDLIRLQERDATTGAIACRAKLVLDSPAGSFDEDAAYVVEETTDRRYYIQFFRE